MSHTVIQALVLSIRVAQGGIMIPGVPAPCRTHPLILKSPQETVTN